MRMIIKADKSTVHAFYWQISGGYITGCNGISGYCLALEDIFVAPGNPYLCKENGIIYDKNKTMVICSAHDNYYG